MYVGAKETVWGCLDRLLLVYTEKLIVLITQLPIPMTEWSKA